MVRGVEPGSVLGPYRIDAVEREDAGVAVLRAHAPGEDRVVSLHVAGDPPGALSTVRFLERAQRLGTVAHPNLLGVYDTYTLEGRAVAVAEVPPGKRLDELLEAGPLGIDAAVRIAAQVASAVDALEETGAPPPPLVAERIWVDDAGNAHLDGLDAHGGLVRPAASSSAALGQLLGELTARIPARLQGVLDRARDGAYLSAGQLAGDLRAYEAERAHRRRATIVNVALVIAAVMGIVLIITLG